MAQAIMNEYRARKVEEELFEKSSHSKPCELVLKHGNANYSYWGTPEIIATSKKTINDKSMSMISVIWKTKKDLPVMFTIPLREGKTLENVMVPCSFMETDRGYRNVIMTVIAGLVMLNAVDFYVAMSMATVGTEAFMSPFFMLPMGFVMSLIVLNFIWNKTHFSHRLSLECMKPENESGLCHFCYAVGCSVSVPEQLWFENVPELAEAAIAGHERILNRHLLDLRTQCGDRTEEANTILLDRAHEDVLRRNRASLMKEKSSIWDSPLAFVMIATAAVAVGAVIWLLAQGGV